MLNTDFDKKYTIIRSELRLNIFTVLSKRVEQNLEKNLYRAEEVPVHLREVYLPRDRSLGRRREVEPDVLHVEIGGGLGAFALADNPLLNLFGFFGLLGLIDAGLQGLWDWWAAMAPLSESRSATSGGSWTP